MESSPILELRIVHIDHAKLTFITLRMLFTYKHKSTLFSYNFVQLNKTKKKKKTNETEESSILQKQTARIETGQKSRFHCR